eukprot:6213322-Pleurochrysis_carterae.AAC.2
MSGDRHLRPPRSVAFRVRTRRYESVGLTVQGASQSQGSRGGVQASAMSGPEGSDTADTPLPIALGGVWWSSTSAPESKARATAAPEGLAAARALCCAAIHFIMFVRAIAGESGDVKSREDVASCL